MVLLHNTYICYHVKVLANFWRIATEFGSHDSDYFEFKRLNGQAILNLFLPSSGIPHIKYTAIHLYGQNWARFMRKTIWFGKWFFTKRFISACVFFTLRIVSTDYSWNTNSIQISPHSEHNWKRVEKNLLSWHWRVTSGFQIRVNDISICARELGRGGMGPQYPSIFQSL